LGRKVGPVQDVGRKTFRRVSIDFGRMPVHY